MCASFLQFYRDRMGEVRRLILQEQKKTKDKSVPSAFVSFRWATTSLHIPLALMPIHPPCALWCFPDEMSLSNVFLQPHVCLRVDH